MAIVILVFVVSVYTVLCTDTISLEYNASRPFYAGATGGSLGSYLGQIIPPGKPWPSKPEDYEGFSATSTKSSLEHKVISNSTTATTNTDISLNNRIKDSTTTSSSNALGGSRPEDEYTPSRPPFAGATGGNLGSYLGQIIPPGKPWPSRPEDYEGFSATSSKPSLEHKVITNATTATTTPKQAPIDLATVQQSEEKEILNNTGVSLDDRVKDTSTTSSSNALGGSRPEDQYTPPRPSFVGATGGNLGSYLGQIIPPGKPWPSRPEDYAGFSATSSKPSLEHKVITNATIATTTPKQTPIDLATVQQSEEKEILNNTGVSLDDRIKDTTTTSSLLGLGSFKPEDEIITVPQLPAPNRPPFLGPTGGNFIPQNIQPGKPWPARPEDYEEFNSTQKPNIEKTIIETTTDSMKNLGNFGPENDLNTLSKLPMPNLLLFFEDLDKDEAEDIFLPQNIQPGHPWHARPEDYEEKPNSEETIEKDSIKGSENFGPRDNLNMLPKLPMPNLLVGIRDTNKDHISLTSQLRNPSTRLEDNKSGMLNSKERFGEVTDTPLMINETCMDKFTLSKISNQTSVGSKTPLLSIYLNLEDIKHATDPTNNKTYENSNNNNTNAAANEFIFTQDREPTRNTDGTTKEPSLAISVDLKGLKGPVKNAANQGEKRKPIKMTEKISNDGTQNGTISATINLEDFGTLTNNTSIRFNITNGSSSNPDKNNPFLSIFLNIGGFKSALTDFSSDNKVEASTQYFRVVPSKTTSDSPTLLTAFPYLGLKDATLRRNVSTLLTPEAEEALAQE